MIDYLDEMGDKTYIDQAFEELKRVDHLIYVSLKYTRTVDVIKSIIERMILAIDNSIIELLNKKKKENPELEIPTTPIRRAELVNQLYPQKSIKDTINLYLLFRKMMRLPFEREDEYRRHVTMRTIIDGEKVEITIDRTVELYEQLKEYLNQVKKITREESK